MRGRSFLSFYISNNHHMIWTMCIAIHESLIWGWTNMETYFYDDARIQELLDTIVEKLFTVCLLTGNDADNEFAKGRSIIQKVGQILVESPGITPDLLGNALIQLVEQRLPDKRVIDNFPLFHSIMGKMIIEGIDSLQLNSVTKNLQIEEWRKVSEPGGLLPDNSSRVILVGGRTPLIGQKQSDGRVPVRQHVAQIRSTPEQEINEKSIPVFANIPVNEISGIEEKLSKIENQEGIKGINPEVNIDENDKYLKQHQLVEMNDNYHDTKIRNEEEKENENIANALIEVNNNIKDYDREGRKELIDTDKKLTELKSKEKESAKSRGVVRPLQMPSEAARLDYVLKIVFPKSAIRWNFVLAGCRFIAQVEDLLVYVSEIPDNSNLSSFEKQGWKTVICTKEDLLYPRRLERLIRNKLRRNIRVVDRG